MITECGSDAKVLFQVADVSRPLMSVSGIRERGDRVIFGRCGGVIQNLNTGWETPFKKVNGVYVLSLWLPDTDEEEQAGFARQVQA